VQVAAGVNERDNDLMVCPIWTLAPCFPWPAPSPAIINPAAAAAAPAIDHDINFVKTSYHLFDYYT
jgi:hypothetical protein